MIVSINQPAYLPWLGYFHRIAMSDAHIVLDSVQFEKNSYTNRNKIRTSQGWCWLTVPVKTAGRFGALPVCGVEIDNERPWARKHWTAICVNYSKAPFFKLHAPFFEAVYGRTWTKLQDLAWTVTRYLLEALEIHTEIRFSSELPSIGEKDELILNLCCEMRASTYLSGPLGRNYLRKALFQEHGIDVHYHDFQHPGYKQLYSGFEPNMAALDLLFNLGPQSKDVLRMSQERVSA